MSSVAPARSTRQGAFAETRMLLWGRSYEHSMNLSRVTLRPTDCDRNSGPRHSHALGTVCKRTKNTRGGDAAYSPSAALARRRIACGLAWAQHRFPQDRWRDDPDGPRFQPADWSEFRAVDDRNSAPCGARAAIKGNAASRSRSAVARAHGSFRSAQLACAR